MILEVGNLYKVKNCLWTVLPTRELALKYGIGLKPPNDGVYDSCRGAQIIQNMRRINPIKDYLEPNDVVNIIEKNNDFVKIISTSGVVGWIYIRYYDEVDDFELLAPEQLLICDGSRF